MTNFYTFANSTTIDADEMNTDFGFVQGDFVPFDTAGTVTTNLFNLGTSSALWKTLYANSINAGSIVCSGTIAVTGDVYTTAWNDYSASSTIVGWSTMTTKKIYYKQVGKTIFLNFEIRGTSNGATSNFTVPLAPDIINFYGGHLWIVTDNGAGASTPGRAYISASNIVNLNKDNSGGGWTPSGTKETAGQLWYITT